MSENVQMFVMNKTPEGFREAVEQSGTDDVGSLSTDVNQTECTRTRQNLY